MALLTLKNLTLGFGGPPLLHEVNFTLEHGERVSLVGRNGQGKSSLMKLITGQIKPDDGKIKLEDGSGFAYLPQEVPSHIEGTVFDVVAQGLGDTAELLSAYQQLSSEMRSAPDESQLEKLEQLQQQIDEQDGWRLQELVNKAISHLKLDPQLIFNSLSGGVKRRALLAKAIVSKPDLLILDEPTNHLDVDTILWLEQELKHMGNTLLFVTHDRAFLRSLATRIIDLDRGALKSYPGNYQKYLEQKAADLHAEDLAWEREDKHLAKEEVWIRQGIKARRTRNEGRVRALKRLRAERKERRDRVGQVNLQLHEAQASGHEVVKATDLTYRWGDQPIVSDFSLSLMRGDRVGVIGPNGCGKTTLLKLLLGELKPQEGKVKLGTKLEICYFDQLRGQLDEEQTLVANLCDGGDTVRVGDQRKHVMGYLKDFLFEPERARQKVSALSGGERNRLLLAKLFTQPANVLVLDEPTNDLDSETLELLEVLLMDYRGTLLLVSHDREFLDNVVTSTLAFDEDGKVRNYVGGYSDWLKQRPQNAKPGSAKIKKEKAKPSPPATKSRKRTFKENRELESLPATIEKLELEQSQLHETIADPAFYQGDHEKVTRTTARLQELETELEACYHRWDELESVGS